MDADYYLPHTINDAGDGIIFSVGYGNSVSQRLFAMKTDYNGSISWPGINSPLCAVLSGKDDVTSGKFINDNLVFVWYDDRNTNGIFAQNIDGNGNVGVFTGIEKTDMQTDIVLYPNPSDVPQLLMKEHSKGRIRVFDARGSVVFEKEFNSSDNFVSLSEFKQACSGFYTVQVKTEKSVQNIRWIKNN
jgi:hypothetical protein